MRGEEWVVPKENGGYSFMVMRKRLDLVMPTVVK